MVSSSKGRVTRMNSCASTSNNNNASDTVATKSFYSKRAQSHSPLAHMRKRRKIALDHDENIDGNGKSGNQSLGFDFHSSDSGDNERGRSVLKQRNVKQNKQRKASLEIVKVKSKGKTSSSKKIIKTKALTVGGDEKIKQKDDPVKSTPVSNKKKFFKTRSPASADRAFGNIVIGKGFDVKFYPKRRSLGDSTKKAKKTEVKTKPKFVKKVNVRDVKPFSDCELWKTDGTESGNDNEFPTIRNEERKDCNDVKSSVEPEGSTTVVDSDSGLCMSTASTDAHSNQPVETESLILFGQDHSHSDSDSVSTEAISLIGMGSEDLFSSSGRNTPEPTNTDTVSRTTSEITPVHAVTASPAGSRKSYSRAKISNTSCEETPTQTKLFPIFTRSRDQVNSSPKSISSPKVSSGVSRSLSGSLNNSPLLKYVKSKDGLEQMMIDAGQKRFGATRCDTCGMVYTMSEPADEAEHIKFHMSLLSALKFPGWKKERVVQEDINTGSRIIMVTADAPNYATKKVEDINRIMGQELGFPEPGLSFRFSYKAFLYISEDKKIQGCCVSEPVREGHRVLPEDTNESENHPGRRPWCCSDEAEEAVIGISRIWVYSQARKQGIATKLLDCVRQWSVYGNVIPKHKMAFSDPTPDGKRLASKYCGTPTFLVYKFQ